MKRHPSVGNTAGARRGTPGSESSTSAMSPLAAVAPLTCGFLHPAQLLWSGGHFPLEGEGVTLAVCGGRGGGGGRVARLLPQPATKGRAAWLLLPLGRGGRQGRGVHRWERAVVGSWHVFLWLGSELASCWHRGKGLGDGCVKSGSEQSC